MNKPVPVALFAYNRPEHFRKTIDSLSQNLLATDTAVYLFIDGPKNEYEKSLGQIIQAIAFEYKNNFASIESIVSNVNKGLAESIVSGVTIMLERFDAIIVLEDDLATSTFFLRYMNEGIKLYKDHPMVASIHGYIYPIEKKRLPETFFLRGADCWGWATWRSAWRKYNPDGKYLLQELENRNLISSFDLDDVAENSRMLKDQISGNNNSWAIRWHASAYVNEMFTLYPNRSLVYNTGNDSSGTHSINTDIYDVGVAQTEVIVQKTEVKECKIARSKFIQFFKYRVNQNAHLSVFKKILLQIKCLLG